MFFDEKILKFNKNQTESKMENPTCSFREMNRVASARIRIAN